MDPLTILAAFGPLALKLGEGLIGRFVATDTYKPTSVAEWLQMRDSDVRMFEVMNNAGQGAGECPSWVNAVVKLQRPAVAVAVLGTWAYCHLTGTGSEAVNNFAGAVGFYLFGDRTLFHASRASAPVKKG